MGRHLADGFRHARLDRVATKVLPAGSLQDTPPIASAPERVTGRVEVAIVGGGIVGLSAALSLARRGVSVALFEKGRLGGEQSTRSWGWCRQLGRDRHELPLAEKAMRWWRAMERHVGAPSAFRACGLVYLARTDDQAARYATYLQEHAPSTDAARPLTNAELAGLLPGQRPSSWSLALHMPNDGRADPDLAVAQVAAAAKRSGALIYTRCAVHGFETTAGRVSALVTEDGRIACDSVIVAAGAWSSLFCRNHGLALPQIKIVSSVLATEPVAAAPSPCVFGDGFAFGRQRDGSYLIGHGGAAELPLGPDMLRFAGHFLGGLRKEWGFVKGYVRVRLDGHAMADWRDAALRWVTPGTPFERRRTLDPTPATGILDDALLRLRHAFPIFEEARVSRRWAGAIDVTPDGLPVISAVEHRPGLVIGTGFSGHGFGIAPAAGEVLADLATGCDPDVDVAPFRLSRFFAGPRPLPGLRF